MDKILFRTLQPADQWRPAHDDDHLILLEEVDPGIRALKNGKTAGGDNIPTELIKHGRKTMTNMLTTLCNDICDLLSQNDR